MGMGFVRRLSDSWQDAMQGPPEIQTLPWYGMVHGYAVVPHKGAITDNAPAAAILVLMEFGHLVLFELPDLNPSPLSLALQELPELTHSLLAELAPANLPADGHTVTLEHLQVRSHQRENTINLLEKVS